MDLLQQGISAARQGRRAEAKKLFQQVLMADLDNEQAWLWLSTVVDTQAERQVCLERALTFNPQNQIARAELEKLVTDNQPTSDSQAGRQESSPTAQENRLQEALLTSAPSAETLRFQPVDRLMSRPAAESETSSATSDQQTTQHLSSHPSTTARDTPAWVDQDNDKHPAAFSTEHSLQSERLKATVLIGCLSVTALSGLLVLIFLWLFGWPP